MNTIWRRFKGSLVLDSTVGCHPLYCLQPRFIDCKWVCSCLAKECRRRIIFRLSLSVWKAQMFSITIMLIFTPCSLLFGESRSTHSLCIQRPSQLVRPTHITVAQCYAVSLLSYVLFESADLSDNNVCKKYCYSMLI